MSRIKKINDRMKQLNLTNKQIAQHVMLTENTIKSWIENNTKIPYNCMWSIFDLLNFDVDDMYIVL